MLDQYSSPVRDLFMEIEYHAVNQDLATHVLTAMRPTWLDNLEAMTDDEGRKLKFTPSFSDLRTYNYF